MSIELQTVMTEEELNDILRDLNESGVEPVVIGYDIDGHPFLAYGWAPGGDGWDCGFVHDDTHSSEWDYSDGTQRCQECGAFDRRDISKLRFPVKLINRSES